MDLTRWHVLASKQTALDDGTTGLTCSISVTTRERDVAHGDGVRRSGAHARSVRVDVAQGGGATRGEATAGARLLHAQIRRCVSAAGSCLGIRPIFFNAACASWGLIPPESWPS